MPFIHPACRAYTARTYGWDDIEVAMQPLCVPHVGELLTSQDFYGHHQAWLSLILQETQMAGAFCNEGDPENLLRGLVLFIEVRAINY